MIKILVADDHALFLEGVQSLLSEETDIKTVYVANNGQEALDYVKNEDIDVALLDIKMPVVDGVEAARAIIKNYPDIKVIILTMFDKTVMIEKLIEIGVHGYLLKNSHTDELLRAIRTVYSGSLYYSPDITKQIVLSNKQQRVKSNGLTPREKEIVELIAGGLTSPEIAKKLFITKNTVESHRKSILSKTDCKNATQLIKWARDNDLIL
ncbi:MAG: response regulator transcription factor [Bacteroidia bacterium]|nr:response regulator transcription factor [Bacteroidia bacterium]